MITVSQWCRYRHRKIIWALIASFILVYSHQYVCAEAVHHDIIQTVSPGGNHPVYLPGYHNDASLTASFKLSLVPAEAYTIESASVTSNEASAWESSGGSYSYFYSYVPLAADMAFKHLRIKGELEPIEPLPSSSGNGAIDLDFKVKTEGQPQEPEYKIRASKYIVAVGEGITFYAAKRLGSNPWNPADSYWSVADSADTSIDYPEGTSLYFVTNTPDSYTIKGELKPDSVLSDEKTLKVVDVKIIPDSEPGDIMCVGGTKSYTAVVIPAEVASEGTFSWSVNNPDKLGFVDGVTSSQTITVTGLVHSAGLLDEELKVTFTAGDAVCEPTTNLTIIKVDLDEATFQGTGNHALKTDNGTYGNNGTGDVRIPQIDAGATPEETEICYTWESSPEIAATFSISPNLTTPVSAKIRIEGVQNGRAGTFVYEETVSLSGSSVTKTFTTTGKLKKLIDNTTYDLTWKLSLDGGTTYSTFDTTANKLFVTAGAPGGGATTLTRIGRVTDESKGLVSEPDIVEKLWEEVAGPGAYVLNSPYPSPEWKILDGTPGECIAIANLFEKTIQMVGLTPGSGSVVYLYADAGGGSHESAASDNFTTRDCRIGQNGHTATIGNTHHLQNNFEKLTFQDGSAGPLNWNNWEACYKYRHTAADPWIWYAAGTGGSSYSSVQDCMDDICVQTRWRYCTATWQSLGTCTAPGPYPEHVW